MNADENKVEIDLSQRSAEDKKNQEYNSGAQYNSGVEM